MANKISSASYITESLKKSKPQLYKCESQQNELLLARYKVLENQDGPTIIFINEKLYPLTGQCSTNRDFIFNLENKIYIETISLCCDCGENYFQLFEIEKDTINLIYNDGSFSN